MFLYLSPPPNIYWVRITGFFVNIVNSLKVTSYIMSRLWYFSTGEDEKSSQTNPKNAHSYGVPADDVSGASEDFFLVWRRNENCYPPPSPPNQIIVKKVQIK